MSRDCASMRINCCDYGCDQSPNCPARIAPLTPCQVACTPAPRRGQAFAPGTIDGPYRRQRRRLLSAAQVEAIGRAVLFMAVLAALAATLGFITGYIHAGGLLP